MGYLSVHCVLFSKRIHGIAFAALAVLIVGFESSAATYYVNNQSTSASDSNPGTESQPWQTLSKASSTVAPGDTVIVRPGTYNERVNFYGGNLNSATVPTTFVADPPREAKMYGFDTLRAPHLKIVGFDISVPEELLSSDWTARHAIFVRSSGVEVANNYIHDVPGAGIHAYWTDPWPSDVVVRDNFLTRINQGIVIHGYNWLVENNEVTRLVKYNMDCDYVRFFGQNITIRNNYLHGARLSEIGTSHVDGFQTFPNNGWQTEDVLIEGNFVESFHQGAMIGVPDFDQQTGYIRNLTFTNNVFVGGEIGGSWGIQCIDTPNVVVRYNLFKDMQYHGVGVRWGSSGTVQSNIFVNVGSQNYYADDSSTMVGGYNVVDDMPITPLYENPQDKVADPLLLDPSNLVGPDGRIFTTDDGYRLQSNSPAIDAAGSVAPAEDIFGNPRPNGSAADSGPHEFGAVSDDGEPEPPVDDTPSTYYVDNQAASSSDNNPGTESEPWQTLSKASAAVKPGDTVIVRPGVYDERVKFAGGNLESATVPTTFVADPPHSAFTRGFDTHLAPYLKIIGFDVSVPASLISSDPTARYAIYIRSNGVEVTNNYIHDAAGAAIHATWVHPWPVDVVVRQNVITRTSQGIAIYGENWLVEENDISQLVRYDMDCDYVRFFGRNITIRRNYLHGSREVDLAGTPVDAFQTFPNNGWYAEDVTIDSNICQNFHRGAMLGSSDYASQTGYVRNLTFTNNVFAGGEIVGEYGLHSTGVENLVVQNNLFLNLSSTGSGTRIGAGSSATVQNNIYYNAGENYWADSGATMTGGYNILNRVPDSPQYQHPQDLVADPLLVNPTDLVGIDERVFTTDDGHLLQAGSPAIDSGGGIMISTDILGRSRPYGASGDIGHHESRDVDQKAGNKRKKFKDLDRGPKDNRLDMTESEFETTAEFAAVDTSGDGYLTMDELIEASLGLPAGREDTVWVMVGHGGPETGDAATPFATFEEGLAFVKTGGEVRIQGDAQGQFVGALALKKRVTIRSAGGIARIGVPASSAREAYTMTSNVGSATDSHDYDLVDDNVTGSVDSESTTDSDRLGTDRGHGSSSGTVGTADSEAVLTLSERVYEPVLPTNVLEDGVRVVEGAQPVAVRVVAETSIDPATLWAEVPQYLRDKVVVDWVSHDAQRNDVWVRVTPLADWISLIAPGDAGVVTVSAGADGLQTVSFTFAALADAEAFSLIDVLPELENAVGVAYEIMPEEAFDEPVALEMAVAAGVSAADVELMYYDHNGARWIPADQVVGFVAESIFADGTLLATFNHAGTVQLRLRP